MSPLRAGLQIAAGFLVGVAALVLALLVLVGLGHVAYWVALGFFWLVLHPPIFLASMAGSLALAFVIGAFLRAGQGPPPAI